MVGVLRVSISHLSSGPVRRLRHGEVEPARQLADPGLNGGTLVVLERLILVDRVHEQRARLVVGAGVYLAHEPVTVQDRQRVVAPAASLEQSMMGRTAAALLTEVSEAGRHGSVPGHSADLVQHFGASCARADAGVSTNFRS